MNESYTSIQEGVTLNDSVLLSIGRLVRNCAEIEDLTFLFICQLAEVSESKAVAMLGRTPLSQLKKVALYLAKMRNDDALAAFKETFNDDFDRMIQCRNVVAHGVYLGLTAEGNYAFLTADTLDPEGGAATKIVRAYSATTLDAISQASFVWIKQMTERLKLDTLRDRRIGQSLADYRKGQSKAKKPSKHPLPPQPSEE